MEVKDIWRSERTEGDARGQRLQHHHLARMRADANVSIIMIAHNYVHVLESCDRVNLIQDGEITFDKPTADTSVEELTNWLVSTFPVAVVRKFVELLPVMVLQLASIVPLQ